MPRIKKADLNRCQAERRHGGPFSFGKPEMKRCNNEPVYLLKENKPAEDGLMGEMTLCAECKLVYDEVMLKDLATATVIERG